MPFPKKIDTKINEIVKKRAKNESLDPEDLHKFFSDIYFETRKILEFWSTQEQKKNSTQRARRREEGKGCAW